MMRESLGRGIGPQETLLRPLSEEENQIRVEFKLLALSKCNCISSDMNQAVLQPCRCAVSDLATDRLPLVLC